MSLFDNPSDMMCKRAAKKYEDPKAWQNQFYRMVTSEIDESLSLFLNNASITNHFLRCKDNKLLHTKSIFWFGFRCQIITGFWKVLAGTPFRTKKIFQNQSFLLRTSRKEKFQEF